MVNLSYNSKIYNKQTCHWKLISQKWKAFYEVGKIGRPNSFDDDNDNM